jgi:hypothetical protein
VGRKGLEPMKLHTPSNTVFFISCLLVAVVILGKFFGITIPIVDVFVRNPEMQFRVLLIAWLALFGGVVFNY